jgi:hypothetical protein
MASVTTLTPAVCACEARSVVLRSAGVIGWTCPGSLAADDPSGALARLQERDDAR